MNNQEQVISIIKESYLSIDFVNRYKKIFTKFNLDLDVILKRMDKKENLKVMKNLGYNFKISSPGQYYNYEEEFDNIKLTLSCQISRGMVFPYLYIYIDGNRIPSGQKLTFVYRELVGNMNAPANALMFRDYKDLKDIMASVINLYEDFKNEFRHRTKLSER